MFTHFLFSGPADVRPWGEDDLAGDVRRVVAREEQRDAGDVLWLTDAPEGGVELGPPLSLFVRERPRSSVWRWRRAR